MRESDKFAPVLANQILNIVNQALIRINVYRIEGIPLHALSWERQKLPRIEQASRVQRVLDLAQHGQSHRVAHSL